MKKAINSKSIFKLVVLSFLFFNLVVIPKAEAAPDTILSFSPSSTTVNIGDPVSLIATIDPVTHEVSSVSARITYDETKLSLTGITCSATFGTELFKVIPAPQDGTARIDCGIPGANPAVTVLTNVATFSFTALANVTSSPVDFTSLSSVGADDELGVNVLLTRNGATVTVNEASGATPPVLTEITPVTTPTNDTTPNYTFVSDVAGNITYTGSCTSTLPDTVTAAVNKTVTFNALASGTYADCKIRVTDIDGHYNTLIATSFTIDATAPTITSVSSDKAAGAYKVGEVIDIDVTFSEAVTSTGNITVTLETGVTDRTCAFTVSNASTGTCDYTVQAGDTSLDLTTNLIAGTVADQVGNAMVNFTPATNLADNKALVIDTTAPIIAETTPVTTPTADTTPSYVFSSDEAGTISYGGTGCTAGNTSAISGSNTATFGTLTDGTYATCTITVTDAAGNASNILTVPSFTVDATAPVRSNGAPTGNLAEGTTNTDISLDTNENATCRYSTTAGVAYASMTETFGTTGTTTHTENVTGLSDGNSYNYYVRCVDGLGTANGTDYAISFGVADNTPPVISEVTPVTTPTEDNTPDYVFTTNEAGAISYGGDCDSASVTASVGSNTITFNALGAGEHSNCTIVVTDGASNSSNTLNVTAFTITAVVVASDDGDDKKKKVVKPRRIGNTPKTVARGKIIVEYGKKFSKNSDVALYFTKSDGTYYPPRYVRTNSKGSFSLAYLMPMSKMTGKYKWYAVDLKTGWKSPKHTYRVK